MIADISLFSAFGILALVCLLLFGIPLLVVRYRPTISDEDLTWINTVAVVFLTVGPGFFTLFMHLWGRTGSISQAILTFGMIAAICLVSMGIIYGYKTLIGMKIDPELGGLAGAFFTVIWLVSSNLTYALIPLVLGFVLLIIVFMYQKKTGTLVDLTSARLFVPIWSVFIVITITIIIGPFFLLTIPRDLLFTMLLLGMFGVFYYCLLFRIFRPISYSELTDLHEEELYLNQPYDKAFEICTSAITMFESPERTEIYSSNPESGTISVFVYTLVDLMTKSSTLITLSLERTTATQTHIKISGTTANPMGPLPAIPTGMNREYVNQMALNIRKASRQVVTQ